MGMVILYLLQMLVLFYLKSTDDCSVFLNSIC